MKIFISVIITSVILLLPREVENHTLEYQIDFEEVDRFQELEEIKRQVQYELNQYKEFKNALGFRESTNNYKAVSRSGNYWGMYQFGEIARREVNVDVDRVTFVSDSLVQERALYKLLCRNYGYLKDEINQYGGSTINGIKITKSGILASAHLVGNGAVKKYLHSGGEIITLDGNRTSLEEYMEEFGHYQFNLGCEKDETIITDYLVTKYS